MHLTTTYSRIETFNCLLMKLYQLLHFSHLLIAYSFLLIVQPDVGIIIIFVGLGKFGNTFSCVWLNLYSVI